MIPHLPPNSGPDDRTVEAALDRLQQFRQMLQALSPAWTASGKDRTVGRDRTASGRDGATGRDRTASGRRRSASGRDRATGRDRTASGRDRTANGRRRSASARTGQSQDRTASGRDRATGRDRTANGRDGATGRTGRPDAGAGSSPWQQTAARSGTARRPAERRTLERAGLRPVLPRRAARPGRAAAAIQRTIRHPARHPERDRDLGRSTRPAYTDGPLLGERIQAPWPTWTGGTDAAHVGRRRWRRTVRSPGNNRSRRLPGCGGGVLPEAEPRQEAVARAPPEGRTAS